VEKRVAIDIGTRRERIRGGALVAKLPALCPGVVSALVGELAYSWARMSKSQGSSDFIKRWEDSGPTAKGEVKMKPKILLEYFMPTARKKSKWVGWVSLVVGLLIFFLWLEQQRPLNIFLHN
jgi:hypothetical protein